MHLVKYNSWEVLISDTIFFICEPTDLYNSFSLQCYIFIIYIYIYIYIYIISHHSAAEHRSSTRILNLTLFLVSVLIPTQVFLTLLVSSSTVLRHAFLSLTLPRLPWTFHPRACLAMSSDGFRSVRASHSHLRFLIWKSILGFFVRFHYSSFVC